MARFTDDEPRARRARSSPATRVPKSALIPLLHLAQEQDGYVTDDAMEHIAELLGVTPAEVLGTCSLLRDVQARAGRQATSSTSARTSPASSSAARSCSSTPSRRSASRPGSTTADGLFTLEDVECIAACTEAPVPPGELPLLPQGHRTTTFDQLVDDLRGRPARRRGPAARHARAGPPARSRPSAAAGTARPTAQRRAVWIATSAEQADADGHRRTRRSSRSRFEHGRRPHARRATSRTGGYDGAAQGAGA